MSSPGEGGSHAPERLYGEETRRAVENFPLSGERMPRAFLRALGLIKACAARTNAGLGRLEAETAAAIAGAAEEVARGEHDEQFPVDVFQTGSGTSSNMNANEVIATLASRRLGRPVHPNDDVNLGQSSNDVIPTAIHVSARLRAAEALIPALGHLAAVIRRRAGELGDVVKSGRTHLRDAMPITFGQQLGGWAAQVEEGVERLRGTLPRLERIAQGGTVVGTGVNTHPEFPQRFARELGRATGIAFRPAGDFFAAISGQETAVELSGQLRVVAVSLAKIAEDLRWMNSGPLTGLGEIELPELQAGSSIMPGKVNPVIPEAVAMVCARVMGNDLAVSIAGRSGNFQLNTMLPLIAHDLLQAMELLARAARLLADRAIAGFTVNAAAMGEALAANPMLVTALSDRLGYDACAAIARRALAERRPIREVAAEMTALAPEELDRLLDPVRLAKPTG